MPKQKNYLPFISDEKLKEFVNNVLEVAESATSDAEENMGSNVLDLFSAIFDAQRQNITLSDWLKQEKARQIQKTMQNAIGEFHQNVLGSMPGWENLGTGQIIDIRNERLKIIAEIKNKWNTTKGNHKKEIYDDLESALNKKENKGFVSYYVEILPQPKSGSSIYNCPFTPPDNLTGKQRPKNAKIRKIDGRTFYALASGDNNAIQRLYQTIPLIIEEVTGNSSDAILNDGLLSELFSKAYY